MSRINETLKQTIDAIDLDGNSTAIAYQYFGGPVYPSTPS